MNDNIKKLIVEADGRLNKIILSFYSTQEFWTILASQFKRVPVQDKGLANVLTHITEKGIELLYNPSWVMKASDSQLKYHILHECLHLIYRHAYRFAVSTDVVDVATTRQKVPTTEHPVMPAKSSDLAADLIVNRDICEILSDHTVDQCKGLMCKDLKALGYDDCSGYYYGNKKTLREKESETLEQEIIDVYTKVILPSDGKGQGSGQDQGQGSGSGDGKGQGQGDGQGEGKGSGDGQGDGQGGGGGSSQSTVKGKEVHNHQHVDAQNPLQKQLGQHFVEEMIKNAVKQAGGSGQGHMPAGLQAELEAICNPPKKDWKALLANYVNASIPAQSTKTWANLNRRFPYLLKGKKKRRVPLIGLVQDTSGSVSDAAIRAFYREIDSIRKVTKTDIELVQCDAEISDTRIISYKEKLTWSVNGRGGTEFKPALEYFDKTKRRPDVVVFFTDLEVCDSDVPDEPRAYKIIWVSVNESQADHFRELGKYGTFIYLDVDETDERG